MAIIGYTVAKPHVGKRQLAEERARQLGEIYAKHGAAVKVASVVSGPNTGCIVLLREYENFTAASKAFQAINADKAHAEFWQKREADPAADVVIGRDIARVIYGENQWGTHPVSLIRQYELARNKVTEALGLLSEVAKIASETDTNVAAIVPVTGENLSSMAVSYQFRSIDHFGESVDAVGTSEAFQALVAKAAEVGTLRSAFLMVPL